MRHNRRVKHFSRKSGPRKALLRGLVVSLIEHERIATTVEKAKELRRHVERAITIGKANDLAARRLLISRIANQSTVEKLVTDVSQRFKNRAGGYTRIIKIGRRPGDTAEMAFIELVDYDFKKHSDSPHKSGDEKTKKVSKADKGAAQAKEKSEKTKLAKSSNLVAAKKKTVKKLQKKSRSASRSS